MHIYTTKGYFNWLAYCATRLLGGCLFFLASFDGTESVVDEENHEVKPSEDVDDGDDDKSQPQSGGGIDSAGKIFFGGIARETTSDDFVKHFEKYGEITDSVIMKDRKTGQPRGFGFVTYADSSVVDKVIQENHVINGKQVEIKRTIPRGSMSSNEIKTKKIFVCGVPSTVDDDEFKEFFMQFGELKEHQIMRDHATGRSRGFGYGEGYGGGPGGGYGGPDGPYKSGGGYGRGRSGGYGGYGGEFGGGGYGGGVGPYRGGEPPLGYSGRYGGGGGGYNRGGYGMGGGGGGYGGPGGVMYGGPYGEPAGGYGGPSGSYGGGYGSGGYGGGGGYRGSAGGYDMGGTGVGGGGGVYPGGGTGGYPAGGGGYGGSGRYHPYGR
ncbi:RNA recognition motif domain-containing protein [Hirschfeldia incana]|nr:RNA recognition motif domain-containing protein [Hirschfeldia incana]